MISMTILRRAVTAMTIALMATAAVAPIAWTVAVRLDVIRSARVLTGSMTPEIPAGSLVVGTPAEPQDLRIGEVIIFRPPSPFGEPGTLPVVHRIHDVAEVDGVVHVHTKGDANELPDPWTLDADRTTIYQVRAAVPGAGRAVELAGRSSVQVGLALPVLLLAAWALKRVWKDTRTP
jgi:signal peptidase I